MNIKGTAVKVTDEYVKKFYPEKYEVWKETLPEDSKKIFQDIILSSNWYPIKPAFIEPTKVVANFFFASDYEKAAFEIGKYSAEVALKGIYKIFLKVASIPFIIKRTPTIYKTYYDKGNMIVEKTEDNYAILRLFDIDIEHEILFYRIGGWMAGVPPLVGRKFVDLKIDKEIKHNQITATFKFRWE